MKSANCKVGERPGHFSLCTSHFALLTQTRQETAEGVGFEPTVGCNPTQVFKTCALNRSAIPPVFGVGSPPTRIRAATAGFSPKLFYRQLTASIQAKEPTIRYGPSRLSGHIDSQTECN